MFIEPKYIIGHKFTTSDPKTPFEMLCVGYAENSTFLIIGSRWDQTNNRTTLHTCKLTEVSFFGNPAMVLPKT